MEKVKVLVVVDMQNDFITGALGTSEAVSIVPKVVDKIKNWSGKLYLTQDTHDSAYLSTQEGSNLPVEHCIKDTVGWELHPVIREACGSAPAFLKSAFGSTDLVAAVSKLSEVQEIEEIQLVGVCTDICVISNAMLLKSFFPEVPITVDASCCAGVTPKSHQQALEAMKMCQIL